MFDTAGLGIFGLILLALDIYAIVRIVQSEAATIWKVLWILLILIFPLVGFLLWLLFGPTRPPQMAQV
ncbi:MAG: PLDc N-terminal domain-containing protein [Sneathiellaceae bacterium]